MAIKYLIGIDEAGRGPLAGPVAVGAVIVNPALGHLVSKWFGGLEIRDSKQLSARQRGKIFERLGELRTGGELNFAVALISNEVIDRQGITAAIRRGIDNCLSQIASELPGSDPLSYQVLLDGSLRAPKIYANQKTIIRGDESEPLISLASIAAKVTRDNFMIKLSQQYPQYHFDQHKGYGTKEHYRQVELHGLCEAHRRSFMRNLDTR